MAKLSVCGFNAFKQLNGLLTGLSEDSGVVRQFEETHVKGIQLIAFAWNHLAIVNDRGELLTSHSAVFDVGTLRCLKNLPFLGTSLAQIDCTREKLFCTTEEGELWEYTYQTESWRNLKTLLSSSNEEGETRVIKISVGATFAAVLLKDGRLCILPGEIFSVPPSRGSVVDICTGLEHGVLLTSKGSVMTWGTALRGQLGNDNVEVCPEPAEVQALAGIKCVTIAAGGWHSCALSSFGDLYIWGWNKFGQLGRPRPSDDLEAGVSVAYIPLLVDWPLEEPPCVLSVYCGNGHTIAQLSNGELWGCGWNKYGQLGLGEVEFVRKMTKLRLPPNLKIRDVVCGSWNSAVFGVLDEHPPIWI